ncbi:putative cyclin-F [Sesbania bispinosa]|nr:putative cyclin-F [Sesbania bispinosa]
MKYMSQGSGVGGTPPSDPSRGTLLGRFKDQNGLCAKRKSENTQEKERKSFFMTYERAWNIMSYVVA